MIEKVFNGAYLKRLDNLVQWSEKDIFTRETVSSHSYKVTIFCRVLLEEIFEGNCSEEVITFKLKCVDHAMFHDWDESLLLRDISHETKYNSYNGKEIRDALDNLSTHLAVAEFLDGSFAGQFIFGAMNEMNEDVNTFCKVCDWLALAFFIKRERSMGNQNLDAQETTVKVGLRKSIDKCKRMLVERFYKANIKVSIFEVLMESIYGKY